MADKLIATAIVLTRIKNRLSISLRVPLFVAGYVLRGCSIAIKLITKRRLVMINLYKIVI